MEKTAEMEARRQPAEVKPSKCDPHMMVKKGREVPGNLRQANTPTNRIRKVRINYNNQNVKTGICINNGTYMNTEFRRSVSPMWCCDQSPAMSPFP